MSSELLDLVDGNDNVIGVVPRSEADNNPALLHREVCIAIFTKDGKVLLQQRSMNKAVKPGEWKISAAGHVAAGENPKRAAEREVKEELGLTVEPIYFDKILAKREDKETRFMWIYYALLTTKLPVTFDKDEVMAVEWLPLKNLEAFASDKDYFLGSTSHNVIKKIKKHLNL